MLPEAPSKPLCSNSSRHGSEYGRNILPIRQGKNTYCECGSFPEQTFS
jgi:hypothetical protein